MRQSSMAACLHLRHDVRSRDTIAPFMISSVLQTRVIHL
jgi:hypothetical protein